MKRFVSAICIASVLAIATPFAHAIPITYTAILGGSAEEPPVASPGTGQATVVYDSVARTLEIQTSFADLVGTTTVAHIHCCTATPSSGLAGVATQVPSFTGFPVGVSSGNYSNVFDLTDPASWNPSFVAGNGGTPASAEMALAAGLADARAYLNIHTSFAPGGEIRGFLVETSSIPEPATLALIGTALLGLAFSAATAPGRARRLRAP
ncbi:MAG TPA: CHRD domain-containing protein [Burkholderiaceae bacterium]|nr:CHRD domain-containing protein [Burkholderiaceae bacterium]